MFNTIKNTIQYTKYVAAYSKRGMFLIMPKQSYVVNGKRVAVYHDDLTVKVKNFTFACVMPGVNGEIQIYVDDNFYKLSHDTREFIIQHEIGHIANGDIQKYNEPQTFIQKIKSYFASTEKLRISEDEINADKYAVEHTSKQIAINALKELLPLMKNCSKFAINEINERIKVLQSA